MLRFDLGQAEPPIEHVLCLGAHADDIEIGCGGMVLTLIERLPRLAVTWVVLAAPGERQAEAQASAQALLADLKRVDVIVKDFRDGSLPYEGPALKGFFEELKGRVSPDLVLTHYRQDLHQDHRLVSELTWNTFRSHLILEYEIPKYDGDLGTPSVFVPLDEARCARKIEHLLRHFPSQAGKRWFSEDLFRALLRLRGMESNSPTTYAEAFYARKLLLG